MKKLGLDIGKVWVGTALSDGAGISCRPYETIKFENLFSFLQQLLEQERINTVVVGHPITVGGGTASAQTKEIEKAFEELKGRFSLVGDRVVEWVLWDERFSTKRALEVMKGRGGDKSKEHSIAAAFILQSYLDYCATL